MIRVLRLGDKSACGGNSKIIYYVHKTDEAIERSMDSMKDLKYFADHVAADADDVEGLDLDDDEYDDESTSNGDDVGAAEELGDGSDDDDTEDEDEEQQHLGEQILSLWNKRRERLITPLSIAGWFCSPDPDIRKDVVEKGTGADRLEIEKVIAKLYFPIRDEILGDVIQTFWSEFDDFQTKRGPSFSRPFIWESNEIKKGACHVWHKLYSAPFTKVFGIVACRVCSKPLGCGQAERNWGALKHLKTGKRSHLSADKAQKQATVYGASCIDKRRSVEAAEESGGFCLANRWTDADLAIDMGLESWGGNPGNVPAPVAPKRLFKAWIEDWEYECIHDKDPVAEQRLLQKYGGMRWTDPDDEHNELCIADVVDMEFQGGRNGSGWCVVGTRESDGGSEPWDIDVVIDLIAIYEQPAELNVEVILNDELRAANNERRQEQFVTPRRGKRR
jgi:hypothetical protein